MCVIGLVGDTSKIDPAKVEANKNVERIMPVQEPFKRQIDYSIQRTL